MKFVFYAFAKRINSTKIPGNGREVEGNIFEPCEILAPVLIISPNNYNITYNYVKIPEFERYYFIKSWEFSGGRYYATCAVDVLASHKTQIGETTQYVLRSASEFNEYVIDTKYPQLASPKRTYIALPTPFKKFNSGNIVVGIIGGESGGTGVSYYVMTPGKFSEFRKKVMSALPAVPEGETLEISDTLGKMLYNPYQYVVSAMWFPFNNVPTGAPSTIYCGFFNTEISAPILDNTSGNYVINSESIPDHPQIARGKWLNGEEHRQIIVHYPPFPDLIIPSMVGAGASNVTLSILTDFISGQASLTADYSAAGGKTMKVSAMGVLGVPLMLAQVTPTLNTPQNAIMRAGGQIVSDPVGTIGDWGDKLFGWLKPPDPWADPRIREIARQDGVDLDAAKSTKSSVANPFLTYNVSVTGTTGCTVYSSFPHYIEVTYMLLSDEDNARIGRPLCAPKKINTLSRYFVCATGTFEISGAMYAENVAISGFLTSGTYWE